MTVDLNAITAEYNHLVALSQEDNAAAANGACVAYAQTMPLIIDEMTYLLKRSASIDEGYRLLADIETELTYELDKINRRTEVAEWLRNVRENG